MKYFTRASHKLLEAVSALDLFNGKRRKLVKRTSREQHYDDPAVMSLSDSSDSSTTLGNDSATQSETMSPRGRVVECDQRLRPGTHCFVQHGKGKSRRGEIRAGRWRCERDCGHRPDCNSGIIISRSHTGGWFTVGPPVTPNKIEDFLIHLKGLLTASGTSFYFLHSDERFTSNHIIETILFGLGELSLLRQQLAGLREHLMRYDVEAHYGRRETTLPGENTVRLGERRDLVRWVQGVAHEIWYSEAAIGELKECILLAKVKAAKMGDVWEMGELVRLGFLKG